MKNRKKKVDTHKQRRESNPFDKESERDEISSLIDDNYASMKNKYYGKNKTSPHSAQKTRPSPSEQMNIFTGNRGKYTSPKEKDIPELNTSQNQWPD